MNNLIGPDPRFIGLYYYDETNECWFYIVHTNIHNGYWTMDLMIHSITGWKRRNDPLMTLLPLNAKKFADKPFVV